MMITLAEFARRCGVSRQAVYKAASPPDRPGDGLFPTHETERGRCVETDDPETCEYEQNAQERKRDKPVAVPAPKQAKTPGPVKVTKQKQEKKRDAVAGKAPSEYIRGLRGGRYFTGGLRAAILDRDGHKCVLCGKTPADGIRLEVDHIVEYEDGGETSYDNGQSVCSACNKGKSSSKKISATDEIISITEFGRRVGVHRNGIAEAIKNGVIQSDPATGKINYTTEIIKWYTHGAPGETPPSKKKPDEVPDYLRDMVDSGELTANVALMMPKTWMEKLKLYEQMKLIRQNREERRRELVQRRLIRTIFGRLYEIDTTQFLTLKTRIIPGVASAMSRSETVTADMVGKKIEIFTGNQPEAITAADAVIDEECFKILSNIKHDVDKFLKQIHEKPLP